MIQEINILVRRLSVSLIIMLLLTIISCEKEKMPLDEPLPPAETGTMEDVEGNVYKTVRIGGQWWMTENLRVKYYRNGVPLYYIQQLADSSWSKLTNGAFCNLYNLAAPYNGALYNWYAVNSPAGLAPEGWRIPTDEDWKKLEIFLGMSQEAAGKTGWRGEKEGEKIKSPLLSSDLFWISSPNVYNSNISGFSALPGGCRLSDGSYGDTDKKTTGFWWSASEAGTGKAWYRYLDYKYPNIFRDFAPNSSGFSVRCVKDAD